MGCQEEMNNSHILSCQKVNEGKEILKFEDFFNGPLSLKKKTFEQFKENQLRIEELRDSGLTVNPL